MRQTFDRMFKLLIWLGTCADIYVLQVLLYFFHCHCLLNDSRSNVTL